MGGEKQAGLLFPAVRKGSPPRGRGKVVAHLHKHVLTGITPAWAGKSYHARYMVIIVRDHPRVGGEKPFDNPKIDNSEGSPPRGRGKVCAGELGHRPGRITPAWAGKRYTECAKRLPPRDHPRVGGEKLQGHLFILVSQGSPPRGRGKDTG